MKPCPFCAEQIQDAAIKCRFCGEMLSTAPDTVIEKQTDEQPPSLTASETPLAGPEDPSSRPETAATVASMSRGMPMWVAVVIGGLILALGGFVLARCVSRRGEGGTKSGLTFREMHLAATAQMEKGMSSDAAAKPFLGTSVKTDAVAGEAMRGICTVCYEMMDGDIKFIALPHPDLDPVRFGIFVEQHRGQMVRITGIIASGPEYLAGATRGTLVAAPLAVKVQAISLFATGDEESAPSNPGVLNGKGEQPISGRGNPVGSNYLESAPAEKREPPTLPTPVAGGVGFGGGTAAPESPCTRARAPEMGEPLTAAIKLSEKKSAKATDVTFYQQAATKAEEATTLDPQCSEAWTLLSYLRYRCAYDICGRGDYSSAVDAATKALSLEQPPKIRAAALRNVARIAAAQLKWEEAERLLNESLSFDPESHDAQSWLVDLGIRKNPRPEFVAAVRKILDGEILVDEDIKMLSVAETTNLLNAPLARNGRRLNAGPADWLFFCDGSPVGSHPQVDPGASRSPVKKGTPDFENTQVITAVRKRLRSGGTSAE